MKKTKKVYSDCYYILQGEASANSCFIENIKEAKLFIKLANHYLKDYVKIHEYLLTAEGWMLQVTIRKEDKVLKAHSKKRMKKGKSRGLSKPVWFIISEQVRLMLSQYVIKTNRWENRSGSKVKESYKKFYFDSVKEAKEVIGKMRRQKLKMIQRNPKYRKLKTHYEIPKKEGKGSVFLCSLWLKGKKSGVLNCKKIGFNKLNVIDLEQVVVANKISKTQFQYFDLNSA